MAKMKKCRYCRSDIDKRATVCPHCQKKQSGSSGCAVVLLIIIAIFIGIPFMQGFMNSDGGSNVHTSADTAETEQDYKSKCKFVTYEEIARNTDAFKGEYFSFTGEIIQVMDDTYLMDVTKNEYGYYEDTILVKFDVGNGDKILEDDIVTIWGKSSGFVTYTSVLNVEITVPQINALYVEIENIN